MDPFVTLDFGSRSSDGEGQLSTDGQLPPSAMWLYPDDPLESADIVKDLLIFFDAGLALIGGERILSDALEDYPWLTQPLMDRNLLHVVPPEQVYGTRESDDDDEEALTNELAGWMYHRFELFDSAGWEKGPCGDTLLDFVKRGDLATNRGSLERAWQPMSHWPTICQG